ncbi:MAG: hypothetical protein WAS33_26410 [Candidatus Promineifilaceae bacterium]|nr:hypothetical protein [Anaerolineaceae bacterium]
MGMNINTTVLEAIIFGSICFLSIGLGLQQLTTEYAGLFGPKTFSAGRWFYKEIFRPKWLLWVVIIIITLISPFGSSHYYDYYAAGFSFWPLFFIWLIAGGLGLIFVELFNGNNFSILPFMGFGVLLLLGLVFFLLVPRSARDFQTLWIAPTMAEGVVQDKYSGAAARNPSYYMVVDNTEYNVAKRSFYRSIREGEYLEFLYNPLSQPSLEAFDSTKGDFTFWGGVMVFCNGVIWLTTLFLAFTGWISFLINGWWVARGY